MRYFLLLFVCSLLSLWGQQRVIAATDAQTTDVTGQNPFRSAPSQDFWSQAQQLVQEQIYIINRIERALTGSDLNRVKAAWGQLFLHQGKVERFLKSQYRVPALLCRSSLTNGSSPPNSNLSAQQVQVYCALAASSQQLGTLAQVLEHRMPGLADETSRNPIPPSSSEQFNFRVPAPSKYLPMPNLPPAEPPLIGRRAKPPLADYVPPLQPAIALPEQAARGLQVAKQLLAPAIAAFAPSTNFIDPAEDAQVIDRLSYGLYYKEPPLYADFLAQPNTGIVRVLPAEAYLPNPNQRGNRLQPNVAQRYPFAPLLPSKNGFTPRLAIRTENGNFKIAQPELDYGFMVDLGDTPVEKLDPTLKKVPILLPQTRQFFLNYRPPTQLDAIQTDRQRLITGKLGNLPLLEPVFTQVPAVLNHTYLVRLVQFKLPQVVVTGGSVSRRERNYLDQILETPSSDLLVAFRPVSQRRDGSYIVLWRLLNQFPDPQINDLDKYIYLE